MPSKEPRLMFLVYFISVRKSVQKGTQHKQNRVCIRKCGFS